MTFGSLFAGIGGIDLGLERAGMTCKWQVEIDPYAQRVLAKHWPDVRRHDDVRNWPQADTERVDLIAGGFPCQDISYAGRGAGIQGERSGLFFEFARIISEMGPRFVLMENVAALLTRWMDEVLGTLASLGYDAEWHCVPASSVGAPHQRDRVFVVSYSKGERFREGRTGRAASPAERQEDAAAMADSDSKREPQPQWTVEEKRRWTCDGGEEVNVAHANGSRLEDWSQRNGQGEAADAEWSRMSIERLSQWWEAEPDVGRVVDGLSSRVDRLRCLGNAVVPQVAELLGRHILNMHR